MVNAPMNRRAFIWYLNSVLAMITALITASGGNGECFAWATAAWFEWQIANYLRDDKKGPQDGQL